MSDYSEQELIVRNAMFAREVERAEGERDLARLCAAESLWNETADDLIRLVPSEGDAE